MIYDVAIIGGGLAGLSLSIDLAMRGRTVVLVEKGSYPRHKVCGEFISMESHNYLVKLCPQLATMKLPMISKFLLTTTGRAEFKTKLDLGGFGISRYVLEELLFQKAVDAGVVVKLNTKVSGIANEKSGESIMKISDGELKSRIVCNATGRKSNFEVKEFGRSLSNVNYVGVKYHVKIDRDPNQIEIHNFPGGYCGISDIEQNISCLCYIVNSENLRKAGNRIPELEERFLFRNEKLKFIFRNSDFVFKEPLTISGINFRIKKTVEDNIFYLGDSAGSIAPITGNGMSMAFRSAWKLAAELDSFLTGSISEMQLWINYQKFWKNEFESRIKFSRYLQKLSEYPILTKGVINIFNVVPSLADRVIKYSHGCSF